MKWYLTASCEDHLSPCQARKMLKGIFNAVMDLVYPPRCPLCDAFAPADGLVCRDCARLLHPLESDANLMHFSTHWFDRCVSCFTYEGRVRDALQKMKYQARLHLIRFFGRELARKIEGDMVFDFVVPVPMHPRKLRLRGFNQSALLAKTVGKKLNLKVALDALVRVRNDDAQVGLERNQRLENIRGAFEIRPKFGPKIEGRSVLLIDDVLTTGATINECARILKQADIAKVFVLTVARTLG